MEKNAIETLLPHDLETFLYLKSKGNKTLTITDALTIGAYVAANYLRMIYMKNKTVTPEEINGVFGLVSNFYNLYFENQLQESDFLQMSKQSLELMQDTEFDQKSKAFFQNIVEKSNPS